MRHIHTSFVSKHLATRGNNKILHTLPPHISSSEKILPRLTRCTIAQLRTNQSPFLKSYYTMSTPNHINHHYAPCITLTHTTHIISSTAPTYAPHYPHWICVQTPPEWLHCWPDGRRSWLVDHKREDRTPPLVRVMGVCRQQQHYGF